MKQERVQNNPLGKVFDNLRVHWTSCKLDILFVHTSPNGLSAFPRARRIASLNHEARDIPMKETTRVVIGSAQG